MLGTQRLLDVLDGVTEDASVRAPLLAEERRLLVAAMGRARRRLLVTAVDGDTGGDHEAALPSAFCHELAQWAEGGDVAAAQPVWAPGCCPPRRWWAGCAASSAPDGAVDDAARLRGTATGAAGPRRGAGRRSGRLARADPGQHQ